MTFDTADKLPAPTAYEMAPIIAQLEAITNLAKTSATLGDAMAVVCHIMTVAQDLETIIAARTEPPMVFDFDFVKRGLGYELPL